MRRWALDYLACPRTGQPLSLVNEVEGEDGIESGELRAPDGSRYPIVRGVPRLMVEFRNADEEQTVRAFGKEWTRFAEHDEFFRSAELFGQFLPFLRAADVAGKVILDAGCGAGRWTQQLVRMGGARVIALDYSEAVEVCARKHRGNPNVLVVQGSLLAPPLKPASIEVAVSVGVIHHLSDPRGGLIGIRKLARQGGRVALWVYGREGNELYLLIFGPLRRISTRLPKPILLALSYALTAILWLHVRTLNAWIPLRAEGQDRLPLQTYLRMLRPLSFRDLCAVVYDQLTPVLARYYRREEVVRLVEEAGLQLLHLHHRTQNSWSVLAAPKA